MSSNTSKKDLATKKVPYLEMSLRQKLKQLKKNNFDLLTSLHTLSGDITQLKVGFQSIFFINHPEYARHILHTHLLNYPKDNFYQLAEHIIGQNILTTNDMAYWGERRKMVAGLFQPQSVSEMGSDIIAVIQEEIRSIKIGQNLCLNSLTTSLTLKVITQLLFSNAISEQEINQLSRLLTYFGDLLIKKRQPLSLSLPIHLSRNFHKAHRELKTLIKTIIQTERNSMKPDLIALLSKHRCPYTQAKLTEEELFSEAALMLFAGHETTANALNWLFITLSKYPELRTNLRKEIRSVLKNKILEINDLEQMPLVKALVMEVLRLFPSFPAVPRYCLNDDVIDGYLIPARSMIIVNIAMIHRHPEFWSNPEGFDPYRFIDHKLKHKYAFLPFINGPRVCIGNNLALLELQLMTVLFLQQFDFNLIAGQDVTSNYIISLRTQKDILMNVIQAEM